jgi:hypothetical protein
MSNNDDKPRMSTESLSIENNNKESVDKDKEKTQILYR